jgi:hypothetical protein
MQHISAVVPTYLTRLTIELHCAEIFTELPSHWLQEVCSWSHNGSSWLGSQPMSDDEALLWSNDHEEPVHAVMLLCLILKMEEIVSLSRLARPQKILAGIRWNFWELLTMWPTFCWRCLVLHWKWDGWHWFSFTNQGIPNKLLKGDWNFCKKNHWMHKGERH